MKVAPQDGGGMGELDRQCGYMGAEVAVCRYRSRVMSCWEVGAYEQGGDGVRRSDEEGGDASAETR